MTTTTITIHTQLGISAHLRYDHAEEGRWLTHRALQVCLMSAHGHALTQRGGTDKLPHRGYTGRLTDAVATQDPTRKVTALQRVARDHHTGQLALRHAWPKRGRLRSDPVARHPRTENWHKEGLGQGKGLKLREA